MIYGSRRRRAATAAIARAWPQPYELNHVFGKRNSPLTIRYPINDHRAVFNVKQLDWTPETLENVNGDPLLEAMARFHGLDNNVVQMLADCIEFLPKMKLVRDQLVAVYGANWPEKLEQAARKRTKLRNCRETGSQGAQIRGGFSAQREPGRVMATIVKRATYALAAAVYMFLATGYLSRALDRMPPISLLHFPFLFKALGNLPPFVFSVALAPLCVIAASRGRVTYYYF